MLNRQCVMKKMILAALCVLAFVACDGGFRFEVELPTNYPGATYYLASVDNPGNYYLKAVSDSEGVVRFKGRMRYPVVARISDGCAMITPQFFVEQGSIKFGFIGAENPNIVAFGTPSNDAYNEYVVRVQQLEGKYIVEGDTCATRREAAMLRDLDSLNVAVQCANMDNILGVYLFVNDGINHVAPEQVDSIVACFSPEMRRHPYLQDVVK